ncbi:hypothetical protein SNR37_002224 [Agarivorans aestuarii]|uniref:Acetyltransferase n=1 Tax=Agarivorans aestuarii TaxID=1563703 RepID=A0ABU7G1I0_9ALTE|nr:hypothetical protein [Agarivorans aestuarii]MEE1672814.1 hypothetical protein [Agarivorans aestuarii]
MGELTEPKAFLSDDVRQEIDRLTSIHNKTPRFFKLDERLSSDEVKIYVPPAGIKDEYLPRIVRGKSSGQVSHIFLGGNYDKNLEIKLINTSSVIYLSGNTKWCRFTGCIELRQTSCFFLGRGISANNLAINCSNESVLIGDDCMFAEGVCIRTHSGHAFLNLDDDTKVTYSSPLTIEPHVWVGQDAKLFMCSFVGACSVIGFGALVTKPVARMVSAKGVPAKATSLDGKLWLRNSNFRNTELAKKAYRLFLG